MPPRHTRRPASPSVRVPRSPLRAPGLRGDAAAVRRRPAAALFARPEPTLLDVIDNLLNNGVVLTGDVLLGLAGVDLVYLRLSVLLGAADRVLPMSRRPRRSRT
jgi:hypothetical protein